MLSTRGTVASRRPQTLFYTVMADPYSPTLNPSGFVNLGIAENALMQPELLAHGPNGSVRLRSALAAFFDRWFLPSVPVEPGHVSVSSGVTGSIERLAFELADPGEVFLLGKPYYGAFAAEVGDRVGVEVLPVSLGAVDPLGVEGVECYEAALLAARDGGRRVRAVLLCNPHNPLGRCYTRPVLAALMRLCGRYRVHLVVDEVYALSGYSNPAYPEAPGFVSALAVDSTSLGVDPGLVHVLWGLSKDFGNPALIRAIDAHAPYRYLAAFLDYVACLVLEDDVFVARYVGENRMRLGEGFAVVAEFLERYEVPFHQGTNAGLFVWVDLGAVWLRRRGKRGGGRRNGMENGDGRFDGVDREVEQSEGLRQMHPGLNKEINDRFVAEKVYLIDGDECGSERPGFFRIVFAQPKHVLLAGLSRIARAMEL